MQSYELINDNVQYIDDLDSWFDDTDNQNVEIINNSIEQNEEIDAEKQFEDSTDDSSDHTEFVYIEDILNKDINKLDANDIIHYQCSVAYFIQVLIEGSNINKIKSIKTHDSELTIDKLNDIVSYLKWISDACKILATRIGQELTNYVFVDKPSIVRSSYNFCTKYTQCKNFYSKQDVPTCKEHHYVHSLLKYDIDSVITFLEYFIKNEININKDDINNLYLSVKTICFVTRHMYKEISYIHYVTKNNSEVFHRNNPIDLFKKKTIVKKNWNNHKNINQYYHNSEKNRKKINIYPNDDINNKKKNNKYFENRYAVLSDSR